MNELRDSNSIRDQVFDFIASRLDRRLNKLQALQFTNDRTLDYVREKIDHFSQELKVKNVYAPPPKHSSLQDELKGYFKDLKEGKIPPRGQTDDEESNTHDSEYVQEECSRKPKLKKNRSNAQLHQEKVNAGILKKNKSTHLIYKTEGVQAEKSFHQNTPKRTGSKVQSTLPEQKIERDKSKPSLKKLELNDTKIRESLKVVNNRSTSRLKTRKQDGSLIRNSSRNKIAKNFETYDISVQYLETASTERERATSKKLSKTEKQWDSTNVIPRVLKKGGGEVFKRDIENKINSNTDILSSNRPRASYNQKREKLSVNEGTDHFKRNEVQSQNATQKSARSKTPVPIISGIEEANRDIRLRLERTPVKKKKSRVDQNESPEQNIHGSSKFETKKNEHVGQLDKPNKQHNKVVEKSADQKGGNSNPSATTDLASEQKTRKQDKKCKNPGEIGAKIMTPCFSGAFDATLMGAKIELGAHNLDKSKSKNPIQAILSAEERLERGFFSFDAKEMENENLLSSLDKIEENMSYNEFRDEIRAEEEMMPKSEFIPVKSSFESSNTSVPSQKKVRNFSSTSSSRKRKLELDIETIEKDAIEGWEKHSATQEERDQHDVFVNGDYDPNEREEYTNRETLQTEETKNEEDDNVNENYDIKTLETEPLVTEGFDAEDTQENEAPNNSELDNRHAEEDPSEEEFDPNDSDVDPNKTEPKEEVGDHSYCRENLIQGMKNLDHPGAQNEPSTQEDIASKQELQEKQNNSDDGDLNQSHPDMDQILTSKNNDENQGNIEENTETQDLFSKSEDIHDFSSQEKDILNAKPENTVHASHDTNQEQTATKDNSKQSSVVEHGNLHEDFPQSDLPQDKTSKIEIDPSDITSTTIATEDTKSEETKNKLPTDMIDKADKIGGIGSHSTLFENKIPDSFLQDDSKSMPNHETEKSGVIYEHDPSKEAKEEKKESTAEVSEETSEFAGETSANPDKKDKKVYVVAKLKSNKRLTIVKPPAKKSADQE